MSTRWSRRARAALVGALLLQAALGLLFLAPSVAAQDACTLKVTPTVGRAGTAFVFSGSGYTPTQLTLSKDGRPGTSIPLQLGEQDPFQITITARPGDEGVWKATASVQGTECAGETTFRVALPQTSTEDGPSDEPSGPAMPMLVALIVAAVTFAGGFQIGRARNRS